MKLKNKIMTFAFLAAILSATSFSQVGQNNSKANESDQIGQYNSESNKIGLDNSKINERDNTTRMLTADQQTVSKRDTQITARIRQDIMKQKSFSTYAQNIKIITVNGQVTLKGPVRSMSEQNSILKFARAAAGATNVVNEIAVTPETTY